MSEYLLLGVHAHLLLDTLGHFTLKPTVGSSCKCPNAACRRTITGLAVIDHNYSVLSLLLGKDHGMYFRGSNKVQLSFCDSNP